MDEEVGSVRQHRRVGAHAAARFVDAPALSGRIPRPGERDRAAVARRSAEAADQRLAEKGRRRQVLEADAIEDVLACRQTSINALAVKSVAGSASTVTARWMSLNPSVVATSASMREGLSARAQTTPESTDTSPDWMPWVMRGRSAARLRNGLAVPPSAVIAADEATVVKRRRRVGDAPCRMVTAIGPPPSNHGGRCRCFLTGAQRLHDGRVTRPGRLATLACNMTVIVGR